MVSSNAAVANLVAPAPCLAKDSLLRFIVQLLPAHQVKLSTPKKGSSISLSINQDTTTLSERNAILRTLCGLALHNQLDNYPYCLLGGYAEGAKSSPESSMALASIASYMSVASMIRTEDEKEKNIVQHLDEVLGRSSFLVGSTFKPTLADYDVFFALQEKGCLGADVVSGNHLKRWTVAVQAAIEEMLGCSSSADFGVLEYGIVDPVPVFFYGDDEYVPPASSATAAASSSTTPKIDKAGKSDEKKSSGGGGGDKKELTDEEKKAVAEKRAKKAEEKAKKKAANAAAAEKKSKAKGDAPAVELDVTALDIRVGKIIEVWEHAESEKLWCEKITFGEGEEPRQILSGLRHFYKKEEMQDRTVLVLCNLKKRNLVGVPSHGMVLCASSADHSAVEFVVPPEGAKLGERVMFEGLEGEPKPENQVAKKKILEKLAPDLKTDGNGVVVWKGIKSCTTAGPCVAIKGMKDAQVS